MAARGSTRSQRFTGSTVCKGLERFKRLERFKGFRAGKRQTWTPRRSHWCVAHKKPLMCGPGVCGPGVPVGCKRAGKRQTWMPIRSHWCVALGCLLDAHKKPLMCGPGVPVGCKTGHKKPLMCGLGVAVGCKSEVLGLANGRRSYGLANGRRSYWCGLMAAR